MYGVIVLLIYAIAMIGATLMFTKKERTAEGFFVGNRNMGTVSSAMSIAATWIWAPALFVSAEKSYINGIPGLFWFLVPNVLCLIIFIPFAKKIRDKMPNGITLSGFMGNAYKSSKVKNVYLFQLGSLAVLSTAVQLLAGGKILSSITGLPFEVMAIALSVIAYSYSQFSGIRASIITDMVQMIFILIACVVFVPWALADGNGINNLINGLSGLTGEYTSLLSNKGIEVFFAFGLPTAIGLISGPFGDQCFWQRAFSVSKKKIGKAFSLGAILFAVVPLSMGILGFIAAGSGFIAQDKGMVNLELITHLFPSWVALPFLFMLTSGLLSTVDSNLCAVSSLTNDLQITSNLKNNDKMKLSRLSMILLLIVGNLIANIPGLTVTHLFLFYGTFRATTLLPTVMTLLGKRLSANGVSAGVITSLVVGLPIFAYGSICGLSIWKTLGSLLAVLLAGTVAVLVTKMEEHK
ncbi:sodium:solute symporter family protein [Anaerovorax sp. IOR16]|uniref:sodium:solute symporter family protein n=1 Tax=Anaerovorax sp. IOR16 TaxID=2773458 RepID=UPI0019D08CCC|nr:hypothetical protein [Anaerovorax sp. IOR16]